MTSPQEFTDTIDAIKDCISKLPDDSREEAERLWERDGVQALARFADLIPYFEAAEPWEVSVATRLRSLCLNLNMMIEEVI